MQELFLFPGTLVLKEIIIPPIITTPGVRQSQTTQPLHTSTNNGRENFWSATTTASSPGSFSLVCLVLPGELRDPYLKVVGYDQPRTDLGFWILGRDRLTNKVFAMRC